MLQRYWGVLDILAIDCEATPTNRQLAQEYAIRGFPTFVLLHKGRRVDQVLDKPLLKSYLLIASYQGHGEPSDAWPITQVEVVYG